MKWEVTYYTPSKTRMVIDKWIAQGDDSGPLSSCVRSRRDRFWSAIKGALRAAGRSIYNMRKRCSSAIDWEREERRLGIDPFRRFEFPLIQEAWPTLRPLSDLVGGAKPGAT